jgi:uncharacterized protein (TIGR00251 family)
MIELSTDGEAVLLPVKVVAGASRTRCLGEWDGRLKVAVAAAPEKGMANKKLASFLAQRLGVSRRQVHVVAGTSSPIKTVRIEQVSVETVKAALLSAQS